MEAGDQGAGEGKMREAEGRRKGGGERTGGDISFIESIQTDKSSRPDQQKAH